LAGGDSPVYVQASPHHLNDQRLVQSILQREGAGFLCLVHDLIPIEYPEYARPGGDRLHRCRMETLTSFADALIVNSAATGRSLQPWIERSGRTIPVKVAPLGTEALSSAADATSIQDRPYFVCIGTIEGRKNHLLLLHLWRRMAETMPHRVIPRLVLIGRRGWENEQVLDLLDRCPSLVGHVEEIAGCPDKRLTELLRGARALLMPSFAEGFGMPLAEALSVGVPVICSDIPAHREVGGRVPDFADPLDGPTWQALVLDYSTQGAAWKAQMTRLRSWHKPTWCEHLQIVAGMISAIAQGR
jgi:glycosyltransferase involved in cell wall biosynthesis